MEFDWLEAAGYRHETLHTGVLKQFLEDPDCAPRIAHHLGIAGATGVDNVRTESRVAGFRGVADLTADVAVGDRTVRLAVETKVDSRVTRGQLERTIHDQSTDENRGVLFSLGTSALVIEAGDLGDGLRRGGWNVIGPADWLAALQSCVSGEDVYLRPYLKRLSREAEAHQEATALAWNTSVPLPMITDKELSRFGRLEDYAWFREVRKQVAETERGRPRDHWHTQALISGPLMALYLQDGGSQEGDLYLEIMCQGSGESRRRDLCLKIGGGPQMIERFRDQMLQLGKENGFNGKVKRPATSHRSCTAAKLDVTGMNPSEVASQVVRFIRSYELT